MVFGVFTDPWRMTNGLCLMPTLKITQTRSTNRKSKNQRRTMAALGLRRIRHTVEQQDTPQIRGMIRRVRHLVHVEEAGE